MKIPISKNWFGDEEFAAIQEPLRDGWVVQGRQVRAFETAFAERVTSPIALACSSGTAALHIAVAALGLQPGDEVVVPGFTWVATANVVELLGGKPVFCDIDLSTFNVDVSALRAVISPATVGLIPVHLFGWCAEMDEIAAVAEQTKLWVVEDAACALGSTYRGNHAGTFGDVGCFSFHPRKSITTGEGGMLTLRDADLARKCDGLRNHGAVPTASADLGNTGHSTLLPGYSLAGFNYRLTDIQGALGAVQMKRLDFLLQERQRCADFYQEALADIEWLRLPMVPNHIGHSWQSYVVLFAPHEPNLKLVERMHTDRNQLMQSLERAGIATRQGTHAPPHLDYYKAKYSIQPGDFPNSFLADRLSLALPLFPGMTEAELGYVVANILSYQPETYL